jgi:hypothetical protein
MLYSVTYFEKRGINREFWCESLDTSHCPLLANIDNNIWWLSSCQDKEFDYHNVSKRIRISRVLYAKARFQEYKKKRLKFVGGHSKI